MVKAKKRMSTGVKGLDQVLKGGLICNRSYLVRGGPGTGKTTLGLHFLEEGVKKEESSMLITMTEAKDKLREDAENRGFEIDKIKFVDLSPDSNFVKNGEDYNIFPSSQVEQKPMIEKIIEKVNL